MDTFGDAVGLLAMAMGVRHMALMGARPEALARVALGRADVLLAAIDLQVAHVVQHQRDVHTAVLRRLEDALDVALEEAFQQSTNG